VGRESEINDVHLFLSDNSGHKQRVVLLFGTGGMGKSQIALEYAYRFQRNYTSVFWIDARSKESTEAGFVDAAQRIVWYLSRKSSFEEAAKEIGVFRLLNKEGLSSKEPKARLQVVQAMKDWLARSLNDEWLLIFDNYNEIDIFSLAAYFPSNSAGRILVTSQRPDCRRIALHAVEVDILDKTSAISLLLSGNEICANLSAADEESAIAIVEELYYFPLAIDQAQAYINSLGLQLQKYLERYQCTFKEVIGEKPRGDWIYNETVSTTMEMSLSAIAAENPEAAHLFLICSFFSNIDIWEDFIRKGLGLPENGELKGEADYKQLI